MALKKLNLSVPAGKRPTDPLEIYNKLKMRGSIMNIWEPQAEALKEWHHKARVQSDVVVQMNTGGGKTLVGLLVAQSLANETKGRVLYVCPNNQLIEQTVLKANEISLTPATRFKGDWTNRSVFDSGEVFCLTNYAAVFNGKSVFTNSDIQALVFDDAHVAENTIRGQFTLHIPNDHDAHDTILNLYRKHFTNSSQAARFQDISDGRPATLLYVPMFVVWQHADEMRKALLDAGVEDDEATLFAWAHLRDHLNQCTVLMDRNGIEITPAVLPLGQLPFFSPGVRRVYLTATLPSQASFARTFGIKSPTVIIPSGKSGDAQRLLVFIDGDDDEAQREQAKALVENRKCCVISPSRTMSEKWVPPATIFDKDGGQTEIERFAISNEPKMLGLVARYDGIDLPGDACRILILDRVPTGETLIDRFIDESIRIEALRTSHTATRIVQAIGRIFRSNTDHGVVLLVGPQLQAWLRNPRNASYLPRLLQQQVLFAGELAKKVSDGSVGWSDLMDGVLNGEGAWDDMYNEYIEQFDAQVKVPDVGWYIDLVQREHHAYENLWQGQCIRAAAEYGEVAAAALTHDEHLSSWYRHWQALALMCADDKEDALQQFLQAANLRAELGRPNLKRDGAFRLPKAAAIGLQATKLATLYRTKKAQIGSAIKQVADDLQYGPNTGRTEEALRVLGTLLGLDAERPDRSKGTGPDVLWCGEGNPTAWGFELKTGKDARGEYSKADIGQCHDHEQFLEDRFKGSARQSIVGPVMPVSDKAHPSSELRVLAVAPLRDLLERVKMVFETVEAGDKSNLEQVLQAWLEYQGLIWPKCIEALDSRLAVDLRRGD